MSDTITITLPRPALAAVLELIRERTDQPYQNLAGKDVSRLDLEDARKVLEAAA